MRQRLGQHFLRDAHVVRTIVAAAELTPQDRALEIGPGKGVLTEELARRVKRLVAIELDEALASRLEKKFAAPLPPSKDRVHVIQADILRADLDKLFALDERPIKILGNLPYAITSPIFEKILAWPGWQTGVFLIQREVAERMASKPGSRDFGILSLAVQLFAEIETILQVKPGAFLPPPQVHSSVVRLRRKESRLIPQSELPWFFDLAHGAFAHRRKTLANSLAFFSGADKKEVEKWLSAQDVEPSRRAETLALADYARMAGPWAIFRREVNLT